jgi:hypothetical protein
VCNLGFTLTPDGIKPGKNKLKAVKDAKPPTNIKTIRSFVGLCNFYRTHIKDFALIAAPLFKLTRKDSGYKSGPLPEKALKAFYILQKQLTSEPVMAFPKSDRHHQCSYRNGRHTRGPGNHPDPSGPGGKFSRHFVPI